MDSVGYTNRHLHQRVAEYSSLNSAIALFTINFSHLHYNAFERECEAISGRNCKIARNYLSSTFKNIVLQISKGNCEKGNWQAHTRYPRDVKTEFN